jgi:hypothetical protein
MLRSCRPTRTKSRALRMKMRLSHMARAEIRARGDAISGALQPRYRPHVTAASTAEQPARSAGMYAA